MDHLDRLENRSIHILREAYSQFKNLCMLWSIGKDSTVLLCLARKAFYGHVPFPLVHIDTHYKIPEMIEYRDRLAKEWNLDMIYGENREALEKKLTFPDGSATRIECCKNLKTEALKNTLSGEWPRYRLNHATGKYEKDANTEPYTGVIVGIRADEEGSRSKERYFSPRDKNNDCRGSYPAEYFHSVVPFVIFAKSSSMLSQNLRILQINTRTSLHLDLHISSLHSLLPWAKEPAYGCRILPLILRTWIMYRDPSRCWAPRERPGPRRLSLNFLTGIRRP